MILTLSQAKTRRLSLRDIKVICARTLIPEILGANIKTAAKVLIVKFEQAKISFIK